MDARWAGIAIALLGAPAAARAEDPRCWSTEECREQGRCTARGDECVVVSDFDCTGSDLCRKRGRCTALGGHCVATTPGDCRMSEACRKGDACELNGETGVCDDGMRNTSTPLMIAGLVIVGTGGLTAVVGGVLSYFGWLLCSLGSSEGARCVPTPGLIMVGAGAGAALAIGLPMAVWGAHDVPREDTLAAPSVVLTPGGAGLRWTF